MRFTYYRQKDGMDCGATCLRMIAKFYGKDLDMQALRQDSQTGRQGTSLKNLSAAAEKIGLRTLGVKIPYQKLVEHVTGPFIAHWNQNHYVVVYKIARGNGWFGGGETSFHVADPAFGLLKYDQAEFLKNWASDGQDQGVALLLDPAEGFRTGSAGKAQKDKHLLRRNFLLSYIRQHKQLIAQLFMGLAAGSLLQLVFPFLTQSIIDTGIRNHDIHFIYLVLLAQLMVFFARTTIDIIRGWILLYISSRINISLISDFFYKLMKLPISYFDSKMSGDLMQRINDHHRIQQFLTGSSLSVMFSVFTIVVFSVVLICYNVKLFLIFLAGSLVYIFWVLLFLRKRAEIDFKLFQQSGKNQSKILELISGMQEIKLHNAETQKRWQWEHIQTKLFKISISSLKIEQWQNTGSSIINELKNIIIIFFTAKLVIDGEITLGMMLSMSYIIGQLNAPVHELVYFIRNWQDARLSFERLAEVHNLDDEETDEWQPGASLTDQDLQLSHVSYHYTGLSDEPVIEDLSVRIPCKKITAIVGSSGSGKTTLMKLLLKFYEPVSGEILIGEQDMASVPHSLWREKCGVVMQDGFLFSESIANNIAVGEDEIDYEKLKRAISIANIEDLVNTLPLGYNTVIGMEGQGISAGQKQRILIARAVYKNPEYLFFDEATSALDSNNEKVIMNNLNGFFKGKTVVIIAHRLSTVKNADQIIVLEKGRIIESGDHAELTKKRGAYFELVKNQLELGD